MVWRRNVEHTIKQVDLCFRKEDNTGFTGAPLGVVERPQACSGGGGLFGSARSYIKLLQTLLNDGVSPETGARIVKKETIDMMATPLVTDQKYLKQVWEYLKYDTPSSPPGNVEVGTDRMVCMIIKRVMKDIEDGRREGTFYGEGYA
jgi:CubicO group peptidase (beta-lactamase class C family)